jgi:hypothetical protein
MAAGVFGWMNEFPFSEIHANHFRDHEKIISSDASPARFSPSMLSSGRIHLG